jgi:hypothetical protein
MSWFRAAVVLLLGLALFGAALVPRTACATPGAQEDDQASESGAPETEQHAGLSHETRAKRGRVGRAGGVLLSVGVVGAAVGLLPPMLDSDAGRIVGPLSTVPLVTGLGLLVRYRTLRVDELLTRDPQRRARKKRRLLGFGWGLMAAGAGLFVGGAVEGSFTALIVMPTVGGGLGLLGTGLVIRGYRVGALEDAPVEVRLGPGRIAIFGRF